MPSLQVRDLPEDVYNRLRRKALLKKIAQKQYPDTNSIDIVRQLREDRKR